MFPYGEAKGRIAHMYPPPKYDTIIEPFCGSARYALLYWQHQVILNDLSFYTYTVWKWLIEQAQPEDIESLPHLGPKEKIPWVRPLGRKFLLSFLSSQATQSPRNFAGTGGFNKWSSEGYTKHLHKVKHWKITHEDYRELPNIEATWFVDPPYQRVHPKFDHQELAIWVRSRKGQVIVCESEEAGYLPFRYLTLQKSSRNRMGKEAIWTKPERV